MPMLQPRISDAPPHLNGWQRLVVAVKSAASYAMYGSSGSSYGYGDLGLAWSSRLPGSEYDYRADAGAVWDNGIVLPCLSFICEAFGEASLVVRDRETQEPIPDHPLTQLIARPHQGWNAKSLWWATVFSRAMAGNAYWYKERGRGGQLIGLQYVPANMVRPMRTNGKDFVSYYQYRVDGNVERWPVEDVIHFRHGRHPLNPMLGISPLEGAIREIATDNRAATWAGAVVRNGGAGMVFSPTDPNDEISPAARESFKRLYIETQTGDNAGAPIVFGRKMDAVQLGFAPKDMDMGSIRETPEERVCAALRISPMLVGLSAGLSRSTYSNNEQAAKGLWDFNLIPTGDLMAEELTEQLLREFDIDPGVECAWDRSRVQVLAEDEDALYERLVKATGGKAFLSVNEARVKANMDPDPDPKADDVIAEMPEPMDAAGKPALPANNQSD